MAALGPVAARTFYQTLFDLRPQYRQLFEEDMEGQYVKFVSTMGFLVDHLHDPAVFEHEARKLGSRHKEYGVVPIDYASGGLALMRAFDQHLVPPLTKRERVAWVHLYDEVALLMIDDGVPSGAERVSENQQPE
ncbi:globin domain-containing protein [Roseicyclus sp. F158]|uniref:Globin domain-containing protein n=1 Tax=Tropicimonas omnivorans TaxID=3075590 RepID=A0ABU3DDQ1_9RHOB|nr:globin domain-containing protein [Roseicyclus sp. F158]MDT0681843.1 globin domain-containing protein [Roseicyclus sp. F158]